MWDETDCLPPNWREIIDGFMKEKPTEANKMNDEKETVPDQSFVGWSERVWQIVSEAAAVCCELEEGGHSDLADMARDGLTAFHKLYRALGYETNTSCSDLKEE